MSKEINHQLIIIGSGPAGITAGIYAKRAGVDCAIIEGSTPGGNLVVTEKIENYPGFVSITGPDLAFKMYDQVLKMGVTFYYSMVEKIEKDGEIFTIFMKNGKTLKCRFVFIATGMKPKQPNIPTLIAKENKGVSYCAICDGALFRGEEVAVIGGGNSAVDESFFLSGICKKVHLILRRDAFRADPKVVKHLLNYPNVQVHYNSQIKEVLGDDKVDGVIIYNVKTNVEQTLKEIKAVYPYIGQIPQTKFLANFAITNEVGFIETNARFETKVSNLYAIGDVVSKELRQIITAINDAGVATKDMITKV